jgi:hypothetical protein
VCFQGLNCVFVSPFAARPRLVGGPGFQPRRALLAARALSPALPRASLANRRRVGREAGAQDLDPNLTTVTQFLDLSIHLAIFFWMELKRFDPSAEVLK